MASIPKILPVFSLKSVYHAGTLNPDATRRGGYEGNALSVSHCPSAWMSIARTPVNTTWEMTRRDGSPGRFVDWYAIGRKPMEQIADWCVERGLLKRTAIYFVEMSGEFDYEEQGVDLDKVLEECGLDPNDPEDRKLAKTRNSLIVTDAMVSATGCEPGMVDKHAKEFAVIQFAKEHGFDGVWFDEDYDPHFDQAPRGLIFQERVAEWHGRQLERIPADEVLLDRFPRSRKQEYARELGARIEPSPQALMVNL